MTVHHEPWGATIATAWEAFVTPRIAIERAFPIPDGITPLELTTAWRRIVGEKPVQHVIESFSEHHRGTVTYVVSELQKKIAALPCSDESSGLILTKDFGTREFPMIERPTDDSFVGPAHEFVLIAPLHWLPEGHFLRSISPARCLKSADGHPCLILPPYEGKTYSRAFYLLETVLRYTDAYRSHQCEKERLYREREEREERLAQEARNANPLYRAKRLEEENSALKARLDALEQRLGK